jgi:hypothetical protein
MKAWFGVFGRSILEFFLVFAVAAFVAGASASLLAAIPRFGSAASYALGFVPRLFPVILALVLFFSMYSFERRVNSRAAGWLGIVLLGAILSGGGLAISRIPFLRDSVRKHGIVAEASATPPLELQEPGLAVERGGAVVWYRGAEAAAADFHSPYPRLGYDPAAGLDAAATSIEISGKRYSAAKPLPAATPLLPELAWFSGSWVWDRQDELDSSPLLAAMAATAAFMLLAAGFRFIARLTRWPLANAIYGVAAFIGFLVLDASLWSPAVLRVTAGAAARIGLSSLATVYPIAALEALIGLILGLLDLIAAPRRGDSRV